MKINVQFLHFCHLCIRPGGWPAYFDIKYRKMGSPSGVPEALIKFSIQLLKLIRCKLRQRNTEIRAKASRAVLPSHIAI